MGQENGWERTDDLKVKLVLKHLNKTIGLVEDAWKVHPGGYPNEVEAALIDSVFSLKARYGKSQSAGPRAVVGRWGQAADRQLNNLGALVAWVSGQPGRVDDFRRVLKHNGIAVPNAADRPTKALAVYESAQALVNIEVRTADDARAARVDRPKELLRAIQAGRGVGPQAANYFLMNLGVSGVKADVWVKRFVDEAVGTPVGDSEAANLVTKAADALDGADVIRLDHAIWDWQRQHG